MILNFLILISVRPSEQEVWTQKIYEYILNDVEVGMQELKELCDPTNFTSPQKASVVVHNAKVLYDSLVKHFNLGVE